MFKKIKSIGSKKEVSVDEPSQQQQHKSSLEPSNEKDPRAAVKKDKLDDSEKRAKKSSGDRDGKGESYTYLLMYLCCVKKDCGVVVILVDVLLTHDLIPSTSLSVSLFQ